MIRLEDRRKRMWRARQDRGLVSFQLMSEFLGWLAGGGFGFFFGAFLGFNLLPLFQDGGRRLGLCAAEHVRMAANHFRVNRFDDIGNREAASLFGEDRVENDLQEQVAQLRGELARIALVHRIEYLVGLLD